MTTKTYTQEQRQALLTAQAASGLSKPAFCKRENIRYSTFKNWGRRKPTNSNKKILTSNNKFQPIKLSAPTPPAMLRLRKPCGLLIELPLDIPHQQLKSLLTALEI